MQASETRSREVVSLWGKLRFERQRYRCSCCGGSTTVWRDESLDDSGLSPEVLKRVHDAGTLLPYRKASQLLEGWGLSLSKSKLACVNQRLNRLLQKQAASQLKARLKQALKPGEQRLSWVIEIDGKFVPTRVKAGLEWREVKTAVLYKLHRPSQRYYVSYLGHHSDFAEQVHGLLRHAGLTQLDQLIGISDGAQWIANLMGELGVHRHILDVYHASTYLDTLMLGLGWSPEARELERRSLLRGELDLQTWLNHFVTPEAELKDEAAKALAYLEKQALLDHTCYPRFKAEGIEVIASGQIEGANKSVIGNRLNLSGALWSEPGACAMAYARAQFHSYDPLIPIETIRHQAFLKAA